MSLLAYLDDNPVARLGLGPVSVSPHGIATVVGFVAGARLLRAPPAAWPWPVERPHRGRPVDQHARAAAARRRAGTRRDRYPRTGPVTDLLLPGPTPALTP